jgi:Ras-related protein Rab-5C
MKICVLGDERVGKTTLIQRLISDKFSETHVPTHGASPLKKNISLSGDIASVEIWDTAGAKMYQAILPLYYRDANIVILLFDISNMDSFDSIKASYIGENAPINLQKELDSETVCLLVGTKSDLDNERQVSKNEAQAFAQENGFPDYIEVSAKTGYNLTNSRPRLLEYIEAICLDKREVRYNAKFDGLCSYDTPEKNIIALLKNHVEKHKRSGFFKLTRGQKKYIKALRTLLKKIEKAESDGMPLSAEIINTLIQSIQGDKSKRLSKELDYINDRFSVAGGMLDSVFELEKTGLISRL